MTAFPDADERGSALTSLEMKSFHLSYIESTVVHVLRGYPQRDNIHLQRLGLPILRRRVFAK